MRSISKNRFLFLLYILVFHFCCNTISDNVKLTQSDLINPLAPIYRPETLYIFNTKQSNAVFLGGVRLCTTAISAQGAATTTADSVYCKITHLKDTLIMLNDTLVGKAQLTAADIEDWRTVRYNIVHPYLLGQVLVDFIPPVDYDSMKQSCLTSFVPTETQKVKIILALNTVINTLDFFLRYRQQLGLFIQTEVSPEIHRFVDESIMTDTLGTIRTGLNEYEKEMLKWFTIDILTKQLDYSPDSTRKPMFKLNPGAQRIHMFSFEEGPSINALNTRAVKRFFAINSYHLAQVAYSDTAGFHPVKNIKIADYPFTTSTQWNVTPLFWPDVPYISKEILVNNQVPGMGMVLYDAIKSKPLDTMFYNFKTYYPISGSTKENSIVTRFSGTVSSDIGFYKANPTFPKKYIFINTWEILTKVLRIDTQGDTVIFKEKKSLSLVPVTPGYDRMQYKDR